MDGSVLLLDYSMTLSSLCALRAAGKLPFASDACELSAEAIANRICESAVRFDGHEWRGVSGAAKELVRGMLRADARDRLRIDAVLQHPWLVQHAARAADSGAGTAGETSAGRGSRSTALEHAAATRSTSSARNSSASCSTELCAPLI